MDADKRCILRPAENMGESYRYFRETRRWDVLLDDLVIGSIWRAERDNRKVCWMMRPRVLDRSICGSQTKMESIRNLVEWYENEGNTIHAHAWTIHCRRSRMHRYGNGTVERRYLAVHPENGMRWIEASFNPEMRPSRGAMGGVGWQLVSYRGRRTVIVHDASELESGIELLLSHAGRRPDREETWSMYLRDERYYSNAPPVPAGPTA